MVSFVSRHLSQSELTFSCYSAATRDSFLASRQRRPEVRQRGLVPVSKVEGVTIGLVYICSVQWKEPLKSLEEETLRRRRAGRGWSEGEVKRMLVDLSTALAQAQGYEMYASDLSPRNVMCTEDEFQLLDLHDSLGKSVDPHPAFLAPEWTGDPGKASVCALGLLALWMLEPGAEHSELPSSLEPVLASMLNKEPLDPTSLTLLIQQVWGDSSLQAFQVALEANVYDQVELLLPRLLTTPLTASLTFECSACSKPIPLPCPQGVMSVCEQHLICSLFCLVQASNALGVTTASRCPFCQPQPHRRVIIKSRVQQHCQACGHQFAVGQEAWRLQLFGSLEYSRAQSYCSETCFQPSSLNEPATNEVPDEVSFKLYFPLEIMGQAIDQVARGPLSDIMRNSMYREVLSSFIAEFLECEVLTCHFCDETLLDLTSSRWIWCAKGLRLACSTSCLRGFLEVGDEATISSRECPTCRMAVSGARIQETLSMKTPLDLPLRSYCISCGAPRTTVLPCRHTYCATCLTPTCQFCEFLKTQNIAENLRSRLSD